MKSKILLILIVSLYFFSITSNALAIEVDFLPLVPCGLQEQPEGKDPAVHDYTRPCTTCDLFRLAKNIIDFILYIVIPIGALLFIIGGLMILLGGANQALVAKGKTIFWNTFIGLVIIFGSWMIVNTLIKSFGPNQAKNVPWWKFECRSEAVEKDEKDDYIFGCIAENGIYACSPGDRPDCSDVPNNACEGRSCIIIHKSLCGKKVIVEEPTEELRRVQPLAQAVLNSSIRLSASADCGDAFHARQNIRDMANGKFPAVCSPDCACVPGGISGTVVVNPNILEGLIGLNSYMQKNNIPGGFTITSLTTGRHSANSSHYRGEGVDIVPGSEDPFIWQRVRNYLQGFGGGTAFCEKVNGERDPNCSDNVDHIHWTLRRGID